MSVAGRGIRRESSTASRGAASPRTWLLALACLFGLCSGARAQQAIPTDPIPPSQEALVSFDSPLGPIEYFTGRGLRLGRTGLTIGGFAALEIDREHGESAEIALDGVNFLALYEPVDALRIFADIEVEGLLVIDTGKDDVSSNPGVVAERLYGDLRRSDALNLRLGKFQTPVGRWNLVPAEPFVWTAEEPVLLERAFDEHQTGAALFGSLYPGSNILKYWVFGQFVDPLDADKDPEPADRSAGARIEYGSSRGEWSVGASVLGSELKDDWNLLGGVDAQWRIGPLELTTEFAIADGDIPDRDLWGVYLQGVYDLGPLARFLHGVHLVARYEHFDPSGSREDVHLVDLGITWIPVHYVNIKAQYRLSNRETDDVSRGLLTSVSVLF